MTRYRSATLSIAIALSSIALSSIAACGSDGVAVAPSQNEASPVAEGVTTTTRSIVTTAPSAGDSAPTDSASEPVADTTPEVVFGLDEVIRFEAGGTSAVLVDDVVWGERNRYTLEAREGQTMTVTITSPTENAAFDVYRPDGLALAVRDTMVALELPESGVYEIRVGSIGADASYELTVEIPPG